VHFFAPLFPPMEVLVISMMTRPTGLGFPAPLAAKLTGVTSAMLDNWERRGFLKPSIQPAAGSTITRVYSFQDLVAIRVARKLKQEGVTLRALRTVVAYLCARSGLSATEALASTSLVTDGHDVYEVNGDVSISTLRRPGQRMLLMIPLDEIVAELQANARAGRAA
jgi:DNA-binding transcriptional MerR regulator